MSEVILRQLDVSDWDDVRRIYAEGIATGNATFETQVPAVETLDAKWLRGHRWVAEIAGSVIGWAAMTAVSPRDCYRGVAETSVYVDARHGGRGVGSALVSLQSRAADDAGIWTLQTSIFPENEASLAIHRAAGFRDVGRRERIAQSGGIWRDTILLERRSLTAGVAENA